MLKAGVKSAEEYRWRTEDAERKAARAVSSAERDAYLRIAAGWRELERAASHAPPRGDEFC